MDSLLQDYLGQCIDGDQGMDRHRRCERGELTSASQIAKILRGKNKPSYTPHVDCGDYVIVINAEKVKPTGNKMTEKVYTRHTDIPAASVSLPRPTIWQRNRRSSSKSQGSMLPRTRLGAALLKT